MATRIHVTATRNCTAEEVQAIFHEVLGPNFGNVTIHEHDGWTWFMTSVWGVTGKDLNKGLCQLAKPGLQFTTSDGERWYLTVHGGPNGQENFLHEFGYSDSCADPEDELDEEEYDLDVEDEAIDPDLAFLEDPPESLPRPRVPFDRVAEDFRDCGVTLPESLVEELRKLSFAEAVHLLRERLADAVIDAIEQAGITIDAPVVRQVLLWEKVTDQERESDLGNLPRLLSILGLGGEWDDYVRQAEEADAREQLDDEYEEEPEPPTPDFAQEVFDLVRGLPLTLVEGRPVPIAPAKLQRLGLASEACSTRESTKMALFIELPNGLDQFELETPSEPSFEVFLDSSGRTFRLGVPNRICFRKGRLREAGGDSLLEFLRHPPEGSTIEVDFGVKGEPATYQRYRGIVRDGRLQVDRTYPPLDRETLADVIRLGGDEPKGRVACRNIEEAESLIKAARKDSYLGNIELHSEGSVVSSEYDPGFIARLLLRLRYPETWDFGPYWAKQKQEYVEGLARQRRLRRARAEAARKRAAPHDPEVLLKGEHSWYWSSDFLRFDQLEPEPRERFDAAMATLGFVQIGDLVAKKQRDIMLRVFQSDDRLCYGVQMGKGTLYLGSEFVSRLEDGSGLTTTTNDGMESVPKAGIYFRAFPDLDPEALYARHLEGLDRCRELKGVRPVPLGKTLVDVAREIEIAFDRSMNAERLMETGDEGD